MIIVYDNTMKKRTDISSQLRRRRAGLGLSLTDVARRAGTSAATLSRYEAGWTRFEIYTLRKLAAALDCELSVTLRPRSAPNRTAVRRKTVVERLSRLFWDRPLTADDIERFPQWVMERVLEFGQLEDVLALKETMGREAFLRGVAAAVRVSPRTRNFWVQVVEQEGIRCTNALSRNTAWNS
jgi:transcriptional regulator with XRE-family HTH domain